MSDFSRADLIQEVIDTIITSNKWFIPMTVSRGRKFRGNCYWLSQREVSNGGFSGSGVRPKQYYMVNTAWDPEGECEVYFNGDVNWDYFDGKSDTAPDGIEKWQAPMQKTEDDCRAYVEHILAQCVNRCGKDEVYRMRWLRKVLSLPTDLAEDLAKVADSSTPEPVFGEDPASDAEVWKDMRNDPEWSDDLRKRHPSYWQALVDHFDESIEWIPTHRKQDGRHEFLVNFNNTKLDPMDVMYKDSTRLWGKSEEDVVKALKTWRPEYKVTKVVKIRESTSIELVVVDE